MASLILAVYEPNIPFMGDEALIAVCGGRKYTAKDYVIFRNKILKKVEQLEKSFQNMTKPEAEADAEADATSTSTATAALPQISCRFVEQVLWCEAVVAGTPRGTCFKKKKTPKGKGKGKAKAKTKAKPKVNAKVPAKPKAATRKPKAKVSGVKRKAT